MTSVDDDAHVKVYARRRASFAAEILLLHSRLCPVCIMRGAHSCGVGKPLALIIEEVS